MINTDPARQDYHADALLCLILAELRKLNEAVAALTRVVQS